MQGRVEIGHGWDKTLPFKLCDASTSRSHDFFDLRWRYIFNNPYTFPLGFKLEHGLHRLIPQCHVISLYGLSGEMTRSLQVI
jgi:hypothetical protein